jgi:hypothetical protein
MLEGALRIVLRAAGFAGVALIEAEEDVMGEVTHRVHCVGSVARPGHGRASRPKSQPIAA